MSIISLRKYLSRERSTDLMLRRVAELLISDLEMPGAQEGVVSTQELERRASRLREAVSSQTSPDEILNQIADAVSAIREHHAAVMERTRDPVAQLRTAIDAVADNLRLLSSSQSEIQRRLQRIRIDLSAPLAPKDLRAWRERISEDVAAILDHSKSETAALRRVGDLVEAGTRVETCDGTLSEVDPVTGFLCRRHAEYSIVRACENAAGAVVVVLVINNMPTITNTFGANFANVLLQRFASVLRDQIGETEELFRWDGPVVIVLAKRNRAAKIRAAIDAALKTPVCLKSTTGQVQVPASARWAMLPVNTSPRLVLRKIDTFADLGESPVPERYPRPAA